MEASNDQLKAISDLAKAQLAIEAEIEELEQQLTTKQGSLRNISESLIPDAMMQVGMESFTMEDGSKVTVSKFYAGNISPTNTEAAFKYLRETGNDSLIKREVKCQFGKGEDEVANLAVQALRAMNLNPADKASVHPMTLKSFIKENMENGTQNFPTELFSVYAGNKTKIAKKKE